MTLTKSGIGRWCERCGNLTCLLVIVFFIITYATAQTASTGAVVGSTLDASGALVAGATVQLLRRDRVKPTSTLTDNNGHFGFLLVQPGVYSVTAYKTGFSKITVSAIRIPVTETVRVYLRLPLPTHSEEVNVSSN